MDKENIKKELIDKSNNILEKYSEPDVVESVSVMNMAAKTIFLGSLKVYNTEVIPNIIRDLEKDLTYTVKYDVFPKVSVKNFRELQNELKAIQERNATITDRADGEAAQKGDIVTVDYVELENGAEVAGSKRDGYVFTIGDDDAYKISDDVAGMKKGDSKEVKKDGKTARVTLKAVKIKNLPALDDDLAQDVSEKFKTLDDLKKDLEINMKSAADRRVREMKNNDLLTQLIEKNPFDLPQSMLDTEINARWDMMAKQFQTSPEQLEKLIAASGQSKEEMLKQWTGDSEKMLKSRIIVDELIRERNISVTPEEIEAKYKEIADQSNASVEEVKKHYEDPRSKEYLIDDVKEQKLYDLLYKEVKVSKGDKIEFADLFKQN